MTDEPEPQLPAVQWHPREVTGMRSLLPLNITDAPKELVISADNIDLEDLVLPELKLCQSTTEEVQEGLAKLGQYVLTTTKEVFDAPLRVLLIFHSKGRALFPKPENGTGDLEICLSHDFLTGSRYGVCETCPHKEWPTAEQQQANANLTSPPCSEQHNFVVLLPQGPAVVRFGRTSYKSAKRFITNFKFSRENLWANVAVLRVQKKTKKLKAGRDVQYATHEIIWDPLDKVPDDFRQRSVESFKLLSELHKQQKLRIVGEDED